MFSNIKKYTFRPNDLYEYYYNINQNTQPLSVGGEKLFFIGKNIENSENISKSRVQYVFDSPAVNAIIQDESLYDNDLQLYTSATLYQNFIVSDINQHKYELSYYPQGDIHVTLNNESITNYTIEGKYLIYSSILSLGDLFNIGYTYTKAFQDDFCFLNFISDGYGMITHSTTLEATTEFTIAVTFKLMSDYTDESLNQVIYAKGDAGKYQYYLKIQDNKFIFKTTVDQIEFILSSDYIINKYAEQVISIIITYKKNIDDATAEFKMYIYDSLSEDIKQIQSQKDGLNKNIILPTNDNFITPNGRNFYLGQDFTNNPDTNTFEGSIIFFELRNDVSSAADIKQKFEIIDCYVQNKFAFKPLGTNWSIKTLSFEDTKSIEYRFSPDGTNWFYIDQNNNLSSSVTQYTRTIDVSSIPLNILSTYTELFFELKMMKFISYIKEINILVTGIKYAYNFPVIVSQPCNFYRKKTRLAFTESIEFRRGYVYIKVLANDLGKPVNIQDVNVTIVKNFRESYSFADFIIYGSGAELTKAIQYEYTDFFMVEISVKAQDQYFSKRKLLGNSDTLNALNFQTNGKLTYLATNGELIEYNVGQENLNIKDELVYNYEDGNLKEIEIKRIVEEI
jgi:hypothetical protein